MSIIKRLKQNRHLDDAAFAEIWTDSSLSGVPASNAHLDGCAECQVRFDDFSSWIGELRRDGSAEAEALFPAERLAAQQAAVMRRLEAAEHPARVIAFPRFARPISSSTSHARRWIAAAAAAGLIVGVGLGQLMDLRHALAPSAPAIPDSRVAMSSPQRANPAIQPISVTLSDDALMARIEDIASHGMPASLAALDSLTPRARDYTDGPR